VSPVIRVALSGAKALPVVGSAASIAEGVLFPNTGRSLDTIYTQAVTDTPPAVQDSGVLGDFQELVRRITGVVDTVQAKVERPIETQVSLPWVPLGIAGLVAAVLIKSGGKL
jgi:hypothetical protein